MSGAKSQTVAITGASGFIGARLAELLAQDSSATQLRILTRRRGGKPGAITVGLENEAEVRSAVEGCSAVVHCAFDFQNLLVNLDIAAVLARACVATGARLVQLSSWAVYGPLPDGDLDENGAMTPGSNAYQGAKIAIEEMLVRAASENGLDVVILQPTIVYGPFGSAWTDSPVRELLTGRVVLPNGGDGICNAVYVDDVCQAAIRAIRSDLPSGRRFLISGPEPVAWREFLGSYEAILGVRSLQLAPHTPDTMPHAPPLPLASQNSSILAQGKQRFGQAAKRLVSRYLDVRARARLNLALASLRRRVQGEILYEATGERLALYQGRCRVRTDRAGRDLDYQPRFDLARGMEATAPYLNATYSRS